MTVPTSARTRQLGVMLAGFCAFLQLYATQPILPFLSDLFHVGELAVSLTLTAGSVGVALGAPFAGYFADRFGRKRVMVWSAALLAVATFVAATATSLPVLIFWRFWQGVFTPGVFAVTVAYINDEWPREDAPRALSIYVSGTVLGGFTSRTLAGFIASHFDWHVIFLVLGVLAALGAWAIQAWLPEEQNRAKQGMEGPGWWWAVKDHLHNSQLAATFAVGFCSLFTLTSTFTYITFYLAAPPFHLQPAALGSIFVVYLVGAAVTPFSGRAISRFGSRLTLAAAIGAGVLGVSLTLIQSLWTVTLGLAICCSGVFLAQAAASSFVGISARRNRALAAGLYASFYHTGGAFGAAIPGYFYALGAWPATAAFIAAVQLLTVTLALTLWKTRGRQEYVGPAELE